METTREIALRTYKDATEHGMMDTPMNWHIWKKAFDTAECELKNLQLGAVSGNEVALPQMVIAWLGRWRDKLPIEAIHSLQDICGNDR